jgi:hypothetical protein
MAMVCRQTNVFLIPLLVWVLWRILRRNNLKAIVRVIPWGLPALAPLAVQMFVWWKFSGRIVHTTARGMGYGTLEVFHWTHPALWQTLFSGRHGLFFWSPVLLLSAWGLIWRLSNQKGRRDPLLIGLLICAAVLWYLNSAWYGWWFGWAYGARAFIELAILFIIGLAFGFESLTHLAKSWRRVVAVLLALAIGYNYVLMALFITWKIPRGDFPWKPTDRWTRNR